MLRKRVQGLLLIFTLSTALGALAGCVAVDVKENGAAPKVKTSNESASTTLSAITRTKKPVVKKAKTKKPVVKKAKTKKPVVKKSKTKKPVVKKTMTKKPVVKAARVGQRDALKLRALKLNAEKLRVEQLKAEELKARQQREARAEEQKAKEQKAKAKEMARLPLRSQSRETLIEDDVIKLLIKELISLEVLYVHDTKTGRTTRADIDAIADYVDAQMKRGLVSSSGRYEVFQSNASNLVEGDENSVTDIFLRDTKSRKVTRLSVDSNGVEGDGYSLDAVISPDGTYVVFESDATNLVKGDTNGMWDVFLHDTRFSTTTRVSLDSSGSEGTGGNSTAPYVSTGGRFVAFDSEASDLVAGDTNMLCDVFVHDTRTGRTIRVSVDSNGLEGFGGESFSPSISPDGRYVTFYSLATNLVSADLKGW